MAFMERNKFFHFDKRDFLQNGSEADQFLYNIFCECKLGNFSAAGRFPRLVEIADTFETISSAFSLLPYVTPLTILEANVEHIRAHILEDKLLLEEFCIGLVRSGHLDMIQTAINIYSADIKPAADSDLPYQISIALEKTESDIFFGPQPIAETIDEYSPETVEFDITEYHQLVVSEIRELQAKFPDRSAAFFLRGNPINLADTATALLYSLPKAFDNEDINVKRCIIEAFTGFDLSSFYSQGQLDRTSAAIALEQLFDVVDLYQFDTGIRYFFGNRLDN